ncbi:MAG TPA: potassium transporter Trk [Acidimicrobiia bacterium]|nr:potassium transporter Trk [Acidimicrobiia bacterium]
MADLWVVLTVLAFFGLCVAFVKGCDVIIGPDDQSDLVTSVDDDEAEADVAVGAEVGAR